MAIFSTVPPPPELGGGTVLNDHADSDGQPQQQQQEPHSSATTDHHQSSLALPTNAHGVNIEAWTVSALESLSISPVARGTGAPLSIPLDEKKPKKEKPSVHIYDARTRYDAVTPPPRPLSRRDSMKRREALLKGNEGSRQRRRWENGKQGPPYLIFPFPLPFLYLAFCSCIDTHNYITISIR